MVGEWLRNLLAGRNVWGWVGMVATGSSRTATAGRMADYLLARWVLSKAVDWPRHQRRWLSLETDTFGRNWATGVPIGGLGSATQKGGRIASDLAEIGGHLTAGEVRHTTGVSRDRDGAHCTVGGSQC